MDYLHFEPLHQCIAMGPLAVYLVLVGTINLSRRPFVTTGARDIGALGLALAGFVVVGPMELFLPETAAVRFGAWIWPVLVAFYLLCLTLAVLLMRPRIVIYNVGLDQLRPALADVVARLDSQSRWVGESLVMPALGVQLTVEASAVMKNVQLVAAGPRQHLAGWRQLEDELTGALKRVKELPNPYGLSLITFGLFIGGIALYLMARDPAGATQALNDMLRR